MSHHNSSSSTSSMEGAAFPWILEHLLAYPGTYEIPLRTMYTLNSTPQAQQSPHQSFQPSTPSLSSNASSPDSSPASPNFPPDQQHNGAAQSATDQFKNTLMHHISHMHHTSQLRSNSFSLPAAFITSFVRRVFTAELCQVDFTQALTALDYLKDLDNRRKRELSLAWQRLGLDGAVANQAKGKTSGNPRLSEWVVGMQEKERKVEALYTQVYIGLRRWTLINEMRLEPFSKANCIAMLNTLYPPTTTIPPTRQLTVHVLESQRNAFFRYIIGVEKNGKAILKNLEHQGQRPADENGWAVVKEIVDKYLRTANSVIEDCLEATGPECFRQETGSRQHGDRRADSGVSFASRDRPSTSSSTGSKNAAAATDKPLPASPPRSADPRPPTPKKRGTTLEKIARELRNLRSRNDVKEIASNYTPNKTEAKEPKLRGLKKMKSTGAIGAKARHIRTGSDEAMPDFDVEDVRRQRMEFEAKDAKQKQSKAPLNMVPSWQKGAFATEI